MVLGVTQSCGKGRGRWVAARRGGGFTLIEVLVVIALIIILVATVVAIGTQTRSGAQIRATKTTLKDLHAIAEKFKDEHGVEPTANNDTNFVTLYKQVPGLRQRLEALGTQIYNGTNVIDGFGGTIRYDPPTPGNIRFRSAGPDGQMSTADDILSTDP